MANIIPPVIPDDAPNSERLVFELLRADPAAESWVIGHKVRPRQSRRRRRREVDFLILIPGLAALCREFKSVEAALYVGMTRARINLVVLAHESTRDGLARLLAR